VLDRLVNDSSFSQWASGSDLASAILLGPKVVFEHWSSGQKIVVQIAARLVAHITPRSLVLIDEPETHLHQPLIAALMHTVLAPAVWDV
jgi:ABC-type transport system involved in cytochrome c biogenesis ATPase subunit